MNYNNFTPGGLEDDYSSDEFESDVINNDDGNNPSTYSETDNSKCQLWMNLDESSSEVVTLTSDGGFIFNFEKDNSTFNNGGFKSLNELNAESNLDFGIKSTLNVKEAQRSFEICMKEQFLRKLQLQKLLPFFKDLTFKDFLCVSDDQLLQLGVLSYVERREILISARILHKTRWNSSALYTPTSGNQQISFSVSSALLANMSIHGEVILAGLQWVFNKLLPQENLPINGANSVTDLYLNIYEAKANVACLIQQLSLLQSHTNKIIRNKNIESPDFISESPNKSNLYSRTIMFSIPLVMVLSVMYYCKHRYV